MSTSRRLWRYRFVGEPMPRDIKQLVRAAVRRIKVTALLEVCRRSFDKKPNTLWCVMVVAEKDFYSVPGETVQHNFLVIFFLKKTKNGRSAGLVKLSVAPIEIFNPRLQHIYIYTVYCLLTLLVPPTPKTAIRLVATNHFQLTC